ncbi:MAG: hypothetical protein ACOYU7_05015 [Bacillota bacterium]
MGEGSWLPWLILALVVVVFIFRRLTRPRLGDGASSPKEPPGPKPYKLQNDEGPDVRFMGFALAEVSDEAHRFSYALYRAVGGQYVLRLQGWATPSTEGKISTVTMFSDAKALVECLFAQQDSWKRRLAKTLTTKAAKQDSDLARASVTEL